MPRLRGMTKEKRKFILTWVIFYDKIVNQAITLMNNSEYISSQNKQGGKNENKTVTG
jgi:hypothetical protein